MTPWQRHAKPGATTTPAVAGNGVPLTRDYITEWERAHGGKSAAAE